MYPNQQPLPVDPVQINSTNVFHSPSAQNLPFFPQVQVGNQAQPFVQTIMAHLIGAIQSNSMKNPIRTFTFNFLSQNRYNNEWFIRLLGDAVGYFELAATFPNNGRMPDPNQLTVQIATEYALIASALLVSQYPDLSSYQTPEMQRDMQNALNLHQRVQQQVTQMRQQMGMAGNNMPMQNIGQPAGWAPEDALRGPDGMTPFERIVKGGQAIELHPSSGNREMQPGELAQQLFRGGTNSGYTEEASGGGLAPRPTGAINKLQSFDEPEMVHGTEVSFDDAIPELKPITMRAAEVAPAVVLQPDPQHVVAQEEVIQGDFGSQYQSAVESKLVPSTPNRLVYDPTRFEPYYQQLTDGTVNIVLTERTEDMAWDYKEHELDTNAVAGQQRPNSPSTPKVGLTAEGMANLERTERELAELHVAQLKEKEAIEEASRQAEEHPDLEIDPVIQSTTCVLYTHSHREALSISHIARPIAKNAGNTVRQYFYRVVKPMMLKTPAATVAEIVSLSGAHASYDQLFLLLGQHIESHADSAVWKELDMRLTKLLNRTLNSELGCIDCTFTSFADDYADLVTALGKLYSQNHLDTIEETAPEYVGQAFRMLTDSQTQEYVNGLIQMGSDITDDAADHLMVLSEYCAMAELPLVRSDLEPFLTTNILPTQAKIFHTMIRDLVANAQRLNPDERVRVFLRLKDGDLFEVHTSKMVEDVYILRPVEAQL